MLPADNIWNSPVDTLPVLANSATMVNTIGASRGFHADFGAGMWDGGPIGIPFITVPGAQTKYPALFLYDDESDPGPYAIFDLRSNALRPLTWTSADAAVPSPGVVTVRATLPR